MSSAYTFLPWARQGLGNQIAAAGPLRANVQVQLEAEVHQLDGATTRTPLPARTVELYGPGDIVGIQSRAVIRSEPRDWITNFEPNYLAAIEFYDEDFPWRYTPAPPDAAGRRLLPWITLVVLKEKTEFDEGAPTSERLPFVTLKAGVRQNVFPDVATLWAWAHVHVNRRLTANDAEIVAGNRDAVAQRLGATLTEDADLAYSRLICPRKLEPNTTYCAFVVPSFETGRLAGLGLDPAQAANATASAWAGNGPDPERFPIYFRWQFRTGAVGDFEYLVRLLERKPVDKRVGVRDLDVQRPGPVPGISDGAFQGALPLGGALRVPRTNFTPQELQEVQRRERWFEPSPHRFQRDLASLINLADTYATTTAAQANAATGVAGVAGNVDPVITPPLYGRWHGQTARLLTRGDGAPVANPGNWVHEINLDPVYRVPAGFGTKVIQTKQEDLMTAAWAQVGDVIEANQRLRRLKFAQHVGFAWHSAQFVPLANGNPARMLTLSAPIHARTLVSVEGKTSTFSARVRASAAPPALWTPTLRRIIRPGGRLARLLPSEASVRADSLIVRVNEGTALTVPPKAAPPGVVHVADAVAATLPNAPAWMIQLIRSAPLAVFIPLALAFLLAIVLLLLSALLIAALGVLALGVLGTAWAVGIRRRVRIADALGEEGQTPSSVDRLPAIPNFSFTDPANIPSGGPVPTGTTDSAEGARFKVGLRDASTMIQASATADTVGENGPERTPLTLTADAAGILKAIDPALTIPRYAAAVVKVPDRIGQESTEPFAEVMAYPVFDLPMYQPLAELSAELLIPNVNLIENNSITLLQTNRAFVEAYMVGLNHEFARELLWREYPTDQRGSYFRQFWDVSSFLAGASAQNETLRDRFRDITPLHTWQSGSHLGSHDARQRSGAQTADDLVLVIRGELLKRYPGAVIYAQAGQWATTNGTIDPSKERTLVQIDPSEESDPPRAKLRTPLYMAKVEPDLYFLGFDLTIEDARGGDGTAPGDAPGWFFVIKERPGEPRFGFDETSAGEIVVWNDLGWDRVPMAGQRVGPLPGVAPGIQIPVAVPAGEEEKEPQRSEDVHVRWDKDVSAAELAYILYQAPVMVAIHAAEMLPPR